MTELDKAAQEHHVKYWFSEPSPSASFISGAEWMEKQMFTVEEIRDWISQEIGMYAKTISGEVINVQEVFDKLINKKHELK